MQWSTACGRGRGTNSGTYPRMLSDGNRVQQEPRPVLMQHASVTKDDGSNQDGQTRAIQHGIPIRFVFCPTVRERGHKSPSPAPRTILE